MPEIRTSSRPDPRSAVPSHRMVLAALTLAPALLVIALDQWTKRIVETHMQLGERVSVIGDWFEWHFIKNPGVAFSIGEGSTLMATILATAITLGVLYLAVRSRHRMWSLTAGLILGGAIGNLVDRLFREPGFGIGHVVDFIGVGSFPRFNIADSAVCVGVGLAMILLFRGIDPWPPGSGRTGAEHQTPAAADGAEA